MDFNLYKLNKMGMVLPKGFLINGESELRNIMKLVFQNFFNGNFSGAMKKNDLAFGKKV